MKAIKGCTNFECKAYKKIHFKKDDQFCTKCGKPLSFVCAECWKAMENDTEHYCMSCNALREQKRVQMIDSAKGAIAGIGTVASMVGAAALNANKLADNSKKLLKAGGNLAGLIKK